jgi:putative ABC transport system ATP-binding protein
MSLQVGFYYLFDLHFKIFSSGDLDTKNTIEIMDLILDINQRRGTTCIMVTHNPDLECYANRILYVQDGCFQKQAINQEQCRIDFEEYSKFLNSSNLS